jgi:hypothetical protein
MGATELDRHWRWRLHLRSDPSPLTAPRTPSPPFRVLGQGLLLCAETTIAPDPGVLRLLIGSAKEGNPLPATGQDILWPDGRSTGARMTNHPGGTSTSAREQCAQESTQALTSLDTAPFTQARAPEYLQRLQRPPSAPSRGTLPQVVHKNPTPSPFLRPGLAGCTLGKSNLGGTTKGSAKAGLVGCSGSPSLGTSWYVDQGGNLLVALDM